MAQSRQAIKNRIRSVESTSKITRVMQLIASTELTKQRRLMDNNKEYAIAFEQLLDFALKNNESDSVYLNENEGKPAFLIVFTSDMGMCGSYNANVFRILKDKIHENDHVVMIGFKGCSWARARDISIETELMNLNNDIAYQEFSSVLEKALRLFEQGEISRIQVMYTHYKNTLTFQPIMETIVPVTLREDDQEIGTNAITDYEPQESELLAIIVPMAIKSIVYTRYLESKTSEQASRRMAMEAATDNADELKEELLLAYNQARQAAITNEIIDIVGGANALT